MSNAIENTSIGNSLSRGSVNTSSLAAAASKLATAPQEYLRPDICVLGSIKNASDTIREELKEIGDEKRYVTALRVMKTQAEVIARHTAELLGRYEKAGLGEV